MNREDSKILPQFNLTLECNMQFQDLENQQIQHLRRAKEAQVTQAKLKADKEEIKVQRYEIQLETEMLKLEQDEVSKQGEERVLELKRVGLESVETDLNFARSKLGLKKQRYDSELAMMQADIDRKLGESFEILEGIGDY